VFNYLGDFDGESDEKDEIQASGLNAGSPIASENKMQEAISVSCNIQAQQLVLHISYDKRRIKEETAKKKIEEAFIEGMKELAERCEKTDERKTASDYGIVELSMEEIDDLEALFSDD